MDGGGTEKEEPNACTGDSTDILCSILSAVSPNNQERDDCDRVRHVASFSRPLPLLTFAPMLSSVVSKYREEQHASQEILPAQGALVWQ
jgi:hypothetical protein